MACGVGAMASQTWTFLSDPHDIIDAQGTAVSGERLHSPYIHSWPREPDRLASSRSRARQDTMGHRPTLFCRYCVQALGSPASHRGCVAGPCQPLRRGGSGIVFDAVPITSRVRITHGTSSTGTCNERHRRRIRLVASWPFQRIRIRTRSTPPARSACSNRRAPPLPPSPGD